MKKVIYLLLIVAMVFSFAACSNGGSEKGNDTNAPSGSEPTTGTSTVPDESVTISIMTRNAGEDAMAKVYDSQIVAFMDENPNINVENFSIYEEDAYNTKLKSLIATGDTASIFYYPGIAGLVDWAKNGVILNVENLFNEDTEWANRFIDGALETYRLDSYGVKGIYAIPNELNVDGVFYNTELFAEAGIANVPKTMEELYACVDNLNAAGITPWVVGEKSTWQMGHIFTNILTKRIGLEGQIALGTGEKKWTDPDVIEALNLTLHLKDIGTFEDGFEGVDYNTAFNSFLNGEAAMMTHSSPIITDIMASDSVNKDNFSFFPFPYYSDKPEYVDQHVVYTSSLMLSGTMSEAQQEAAIKLVKYLTTSEAIQARYDIYRVAPYKDVTVSSDAPKIFLDMIHYTSSLNVTASEYFDYDTSPTLCDASRNAILDMLLGTSPEDTAATIQSSIDADR